MEYEEMDRQMFDAVVTGEMTHRAIGLEQSLDVAIASFFVGKSDIDGAFERLILRRQGLDTQSKVEIVRAIVEEIAMTQDERQRSKSTLRRVEEFIKLRNSMAHGVDQGGDALNLSIETIRRDGRRKIIVVSPELHRKILDGYEELQVQVGLIVTLVEAQKQKATE